MAYTPTCLSFMFGSLASWMINNQELIQALQAHGVQFSFGRLKQLLGAPIGTPSFCAQPGGHLDSVVAEASSLIKQVLQIDHAQAQYHLL